MALNQSESIKSGQFESQLLADTPMPLSVKPVVPNYPILGKLVGPKDARLLRVLHVYKLFSPVRGGGIAAMESIIRGLKGRVSASVLVATKVGLGGQDQKCGAKVRRVMSLGYIKSMPAAPTLPFWYAVMSRQVDLIHVHLPFPIADLAMNLWRPQAPVVVHWHSDIVQQVWTKRLLRPFLRRSLKRANKIIVGSPRHIESSKELQPFKDKCVVVPYGIDIDKWSVADSAVKSEVNALRKKHPRMVLFLGRLVAYKGLPVLLRAMKEVDGSLVIAGEGPMESVLLRLAGTLGVENKVTFTGALSFQELKAHYHACSVFVLPSIWRNEAFGLAQIEAMACRKPVVNTDLPTGVPWVARDGIEGITVAPNSARELAQAIQKLLDTPDLAKKLGDAGFDRVSTKFNQTITSEKLYSVYRNLVKQPTSSMRTKERLAE